MRLSDFIPDKMYIMLKYFKYFHRFPNLRNPITFNEKINWLKFNNRKKKYTFMVDKYESKNYLREGVGEQYIVPNYGVWNSFEEIDFNTLPN